MTDKESRRKQRQIELNNLQVRPRKNKTNYLVKKNNLPRVEDDTSPLTVEHILESLLPFIDSWCDKYGVDDLVKAPQRQFNALCSDIGRNARQKRLYKATDVIDNGSAALSTCNRYDMNKIIEGINAFSFVCDLYNKAFLVGTLAAFLGISKQDLFKWGDELRALGVDVFEKREESLSSSAVDSKTTNITGVLASLNHWHGWTKESRTTHEKETIVIYPSLGLTQNSTPQIQTNQVL